MRASGWIGLSFAGGVLLGIQVLNSPRPQSTPGVEAHAENGGGNDRGSVVKGGPAVGIAKRETDDSQGLENQSLEQQIARMERMEERLKNGSRTELLLFLKTLQRFSFEQLNALRGGLESSKKADRVRGHLAEAMASKDAVLAWQQGTEKKDFSLAHAGLGEIAALDYTAALRSYFEQPEEIRRSVTMPIPERGRKPAGDLEAAWRLVVEQGKTVDVVKLGEPDPNGKAAQFLRLLVPLAAARARSGAEAFEQARSTLLELAALKTDGKPGEAKTRVYSEMYNVISMFQRQLGDEAGGEFVAALKPQERMALNYYEEASRVLRTSGMDAAVEMMLKAEHLHQVSSAFTQIWDRWRAEDGEGARRALEALPGGTAREGVYMGLRILVMSFAESRGADYFTRNVTERLEGFSNEFKMGFYEYALGRSGRWANTHPLQIDALDLPPQLKEQLRKKTAPVRLPDK
jgi:hypothetical protein